MTPSNEADQQGREPRVVNLQRAFASIDEHWSPRVAGQVSGHEVRLAKLKGEFVWHAHDEADEMFLVVRGAMRIELRDRTLRLREGEFAVVPRGVEHKPVAEEECSVLLIEPAGTLNTGDAPESERTKRELPRI